MNQKLDRIKLFLKAFLPCITCSILNVLNINLSQIKKTAQSDLHACTVFGIT